VFGASLSTLVSHPALYGWNFDDVLYSTDGFGPIPAALTNRLLAADHDVIAQSGGYFANVEIDSLTVPLIVTPSRASVAPPVLSGHGVDSAHDIVLGPQTLRSLHKRIGDHVVLSGGGIGPLTLRIAGTATLPTIGETLGEHASMSTGAVMSIAAVPPAVADPAPPKYANLFGPNAVFIRLRSGINPAAAKRRLERIVKAANALYRSPEAVQVFGQGGQGGLTVSLLPVERPAEITNYSSMGTTPSVLAGSLAAGVVVALALTLFASVRRRRRDLALLKTLGFTRRQLLAAVAWQATTVAIVGVVIGVPLGIALGRWLWVLFARNISAVPHATVSAATIAAVIGGALLLANLAAAFPARQAARTSTSWLLQAD
jgi:FtsX-like permease family